MLLFKEKLIKTKLYMLKSTLSRQQLFVLNRVSYIVYQFTVLKCPFLFFLVKKFKIFSHNKKFTLLTVYF